MAGPGIEDLQADWGNMLDKTGQNSIDPGAILRDPSIVNDLYPFDATTGAPDVTIKTTQKTAAPSGLVDSIKAKLRGLLGCQ